MTDPQTKRRRGCFFYGCLTGCVLLIFMLMGLLLGLHHLKKTFENFTDAQPIVLPTTEYSAAQAKELDQRIAAFQTALEAKTATSPLALSVDDLNALVASKPDLRGKLHLSIEQDQLRTQVSVPMRELGLPFFKGRYLNGTATLGVSVRDGQLVVSAQGISSKGNSLPAVYEEKVRQQNLAANLKLDPGLSAALGQVQAIEIKDGKVLVVPKSQPPAR